MLIRDFKYNDKEIYKRMSNSFYKSDATLEEVSGEAVDDTFDEIMHHSPFIRGLMLMEGEVIVGYALLTFTWSCELEGILVTIDELFICDDYRDCGYGSSFFQWLEQEYSLDEYSYALEVSPHNPKAEKLYQRLGYHREAYISMLKE